MSQIFRPTPNPFAIKNIRLFIAFRLFFNSRFYYPIFTILFLDFGLSLSQFALLNAVWAATIVLLEVPSGALADTIGRRKLLVASGILMVIEMGLLCMAPKGYPDLLFTVFLINRFVSGAAEAAASGADEALAYDTLKYEGNVSDWSRVLAVQMRIQSIGFVVAMSLGAAVYDPVLMQRISTWIGLNISFTRDITLRLPIVLTFIMAVLTLATAIKMQESPKATEEGTCLDEKGCSQSIVDALKLTLDAGKWILKTPFALAVIGAGFLFDSVIRMIITMTSQYYRIILLPEASFGIIGSGLALLGLFIPKVAMELTQKYTPSINLMVVAGATFLGLVGMALCMPIFGLLPVVLLISIMFMTGFMISHYLNRITPSNERATVLSFKGLFYNLAFGVIGLLYAVLLAFLRSDVTRHFPGIAEETLKNAVFSRSLAYFPVYFFVIACLFMIIAGRKLSRSHEHRQRG